MFHTGKGYQKDLTHDCPQESSEIDLLGLSFGPILKVSDQRCASTSMTFPRWPRLAPQHHQVPWAPMAQIPSSNLSLCFHLLLTAGSSLNLVSRHRSQETLQLMSQAKKAPNTSSKSVHHSSSTLIQQNLCLPFYSRCGGRSYVKIIRNVAKSTSCEKAAASQFKDRNAG